MNEFWCHCDPHGDNARCDRPCCKPRHIQAAEAAAIVERARQAKPSPEDMAEAVETLRLFASRVRGTGVRLGGRGMSWM